ncbi:GNAT family N-acetyltransferase [Acinetobacter pittii]|uniref:GNAT family N-acetyltransferase n=1 Tax=Acinetobacter pittii TaxID=48296 RepID=UPI00083DD723|nr:GNAT family N-acetyltransferase [Acinetobacter pittii]MCK0911672.1 GNAT family N-acetyltransferase [Acinetobacter pittii]
MLETERLILRQWKDSDKLPFIEMGMDHDVMKYLPNFLDEEQSVKLIQMASEIINKNEWGIWAVELKDSHEFIGFIGLHNQPTLFEFSPCVEIAWRLAKKYWGNGYATEGAKATLEYAFKTLQLNKVVSFTATINEPSKSVMKKLGMTKVKEFNHPEFSLNKHLKKHVLYEIFNPYSK